MMAAVIGVVAMDDEQEADAAVGDQFEVDELVFEIIADGEVEVAGYNTEPSDDLEIPESVSYGGMSYVVTSIGNEAFMECFELITVYIPDSVISIGDAAFAECYEMVFINIPNNVISIGDEAFHGCSGLTSIIIPNSVTTIGDSTFAMCYGLNRVIIPDTVDSIGTQAFYGCESLTSITIPESVGFIGDWAFAGCYLTSIIFESAIVPTMGYDCFDTMTETSVWTPGWDPVTALADAHGSDTTIVWANPPYPDLTFLSNPIMNGTLAYNPLRTSKTDLTA